MEIINTILSYQLLKVGSYTLTIGMLLTLLFIVIFTNILVLVIKKILFKSKKFKNIEEGSLNSLFQITKYLIWVFAIIMILDTTGVKLNVLLAGSAALLVGVGLGLQNTFNDFISGIILLFEGTIRVGDILEIDKEIVKIQEIGLRTSEAIDRDDVVIILPNSLITTNKVINWSHQSKKTRFRILVGVAYGSDVKLVLQLLKQSALDHPEITDKTLINTRFKDFGNSSLDFELLFFSKNIFRIENLKSEIRQIINQKFIDHNITIPFPQMDLHIRSNDTDGFKK